MNRFLSIGEAAERLGVSITTLRRWEALGRLVPKRTQAGHRRYDAALIESLYGAHAQEKTDGRTIAYARVSSSDQKADLEKQKQILELFCTGRGWRFEMISDFGSGMNYHKKRASSTFEYISQRGRGASRYYSEGSIAEIRRRTCICRM